MRHYKFPFWAYIYLFHDFDIAYFVRRLGGQVVGNVKFKDLRELSTFPYNLFDSVISKPSRYHGSYGQMFEVRSLDSLHFQLLSLGKL